MEAPHCVVDEVLDGEEPGSGGNQSQIDHLRFAQMMFASLTDLSG